jgi:N-acetylglutamate synthase/N-acetylornithine aminotransferase
MAERHLDITCDLGLGDGRATILTNDLTPAYIAENTGGS